MVSTVQDRDNFGPESDFFIVISFITGIQKRAIGTSLAQHSSFDDARSNVEAGGLTTARIIDSDFEELFGNSNSGNGEAGLE